MHNNKLPGHAPTSRRMSAWAMAALVALAAVVALPALADGDLPSLFNNRGSIANTRHNLTQRQQGGGGPNSSFMDRGRNDYGEVCVYCHTPHGANQNVTLPLWNRTIATTTYTTYNQLGTSTLTQPVTQPGANSLSCLSCHDGQVAVDSVINMPGSGRYLAAQAATQNNTFLNGWSNPSGTNAVSHMSLNANPAATPSCLSCHSGAVQGLGATDFSVFVIGTDLRNDHPVGVRFPDAGPGVDFNQPGGNRTGMRWFDTNGNGFPDTREVRLYDTGEGMEVECASCHDPHGVPSGAAGSTFNPTFLRVSNTASALCLTCHAK